MKLVDVSGEPVSRIDGRDHMVVTVRDVIGRRSGREDPLALNPREHGLVAIDLNAQVVCALACREGVKPDRASLAIDDLRALHARRIRRRGSQKDEAGSRVRARLENGDGNGLRHIDRRTPVATGISKGGGSEQSQNSDADDTVTQPWDRWFHDNEPPVDGGNSVRPLPRFDVQFLSGWCDGSWACKGFQTSSATSKPV